MKMYLADETYENEDGQQIRSDEIDCLGTYELKCDGFFRWICGDCGHEARSRAFRIGGTVWKCLECGKRNLLARTDMRFLLQVQRNAERCDGEAQRAIKESLNYLGQAITALGKHR